MEEKIKSPPCDLCKENEGNIWIHSDGGIGSPLRYGNNAHICDDCNKNRKEEVDAKAQLLQLFDIS